MLPSVAHITALQLHSVYNITTAAIPTDMM